VRPATRALIAVFLVATLIHAAIASPAQDQSSQAVSQSPAAGPLVTLQGVVLNTNTGQPLPRALVRIEGDANTGALTDSEGRFQIPGLPAGPQTIRIHKPGFRDRSYATEDVGYQSDGPAHNVLVAAGMPDLVFTLTPTSAIYGHVDLSTGDPAQGISLTLLKQVVSNGRAVWVQNSTTKTIHLSGICGTAMASLAGLLQLQGHTIQGSDKAAYPPMSDLLHSLGIRIVEPFAEENLDPRPDLVVIGRHPGSHGPGAVTHAVLNHAHGPVVSVPSA